MAHMAQAYQHAAGLPPAEVVDVAEQLGIDFAVAPFSVEELKLGIEVELEQERLVTAAAPATGAAANLTEAGLHAIAHLQERHDFYTVLTTAHAPGDPPPPWYEHADIGTD